MAGSRSKGTRVRAPKGKVVAAGRELSIEGLKLQMSPVAQSLSFVVRAPTDQKFKEIRAVLQTTTGVRITSEVPNRRALAVESLALEALPPIVHDEGVVVRPERQYAPEAG